MDLLDADDPFVVGTQHLGAGDRADVVAALHRLEAATAAAEPAHPDRVLAAAATLEDLLDEHELTHLVQRLRDRTAPYERALLRIRLQERLTADLSSDDPDVRGEALWTLGVALDRSIGDRAAAIDVYRRAMATTRPAWVPVVAAMNLAQLLEADGDVEGARRAYGLVVERGPLLRDHPVVDAGIHEIAAGRIADLPR